MARQADRARFRLISSVDVTCESYYDPVRKAFTPRRIVTPATFSVTWPDGTPCSLVEMYLVSKFRRGVSVAADGGTLRATVSKLVHLVTYCWKAKRDFWELKDDDISQLIETLMSETKPKAPLQRVRDNNTVCAIIAGVVEFLSWLQDEFMVGLPLIGVGPEFHIRLVERKVLDSRGKRYIVRRVYHRLPPRDTKEPKRPIGRDKRNALWSAVSRMAGITPVQPAWARSEEHGRLLSDYLKARRELLLELLEATGARPGELSRLSVSRNDGCYESRELVLVTLKRRRYIERKIKLQAAVAMRLNVFIRMHRASLLKAIERGGGVANPRDLVFLGILGSPLSERSMTSEFSRISGEAGLSEYQSCMSMFRHRFITKQVAIHLGIYVGRENRARGMMTDADYRTILRKVATVTGHGDERSLLHYLDLAWEELGIAHRIDSALAVDASIDSLTPQIISLAGTLAHTAGKNAAQTLQIVREVLITLQHSLRGAAGQQGQAALSC